MENIVIATTDDISTVVHEALRGPLEDLWPAAIIPHRKEAQLVMKAMTDEFISMALRPVENAHARALVDTWSTNQAPTELTTIKEHFILKLTELKANMHNINQYFRGKKHGLAVVDLSTQSNKQIPQSKQAGFKRSRDQTAPRQQRSAASTHPTATQCPTCGNYHNKDLKKGFANGDCAYQTHPDANTERANGVITPWPTSTVGKKYAGANKTCLHGALISMGTRWTHLYPRQLPQHRDNHRTNPPKVRPAARGNQPPAPQSPITLRNETDKDGVRHYHLSNNTFFRQWTTHPIFP